MKFSSSLLQLDFITTFFFFHSDLNSPTCHCLVFKFASCPIAQFSLPHRTHVKPFNGKSAQYPPELILLISFYEDGKIQTMAYIVL